MENVVYVYNKYGELIATFDGDGEGLDEVKKRNMMIAPTVHIETNGASTLSFQMLVNTEKWQTIKDPENYYYLNGRYYTALNDGSYEYVGDGTVRYVNVTLVEIWYLLDKKFTQVYNCGIYCYAKARFVRYVPDGAEFQISSSDCSNAGDTITATNAWTQVKQWQTHYDGEQISYPILQSEEQKPTGWENTPAAVHFESFNVSGDTATVTIKARAKKTVYKSFEYVSIGSYQLEGVPYPSSIKDVSITSTITSETEDKVTYTTSTKNVPYSYNSETGVFYINYNPSDNEEVASVSCSYDFYDIGNISSGATCHFAYGAEVVDEHTVLVLPKADTKYKLTIDGVEYDDSEVRDSRGILMPRGSGGYAMWAVLKNSGWKLGICDVIAKGFDTSIDYGCFNIESDMKDVLYNIQYIQQLYGGILDWNSKEKVLNYRAENAEDYDSYNDGFNTWTGYEFREGKNLVDQPSITVDNNLLTKAYLLGYGNLNVKNVNGGKTYIEDYSYTDQVYEGYLEQPLIYDTNDDGGMNQLLYWGRKELAKRCRPRKTISVNGRDIRGVPGYEHEVFDINDVVRVYYKDSETGHEVQEEKRINLWEYNAFAMYDCSIEMGDKTQNLAQLFKLIYNKAVEDAPSTDASGNISSSDLVIEVPKYTLDPSGIGGGLGSGIGGGGIGTSLTDYISLITRTTTENSEALAGLILDTTDLYAKTELFSSYQKQTDKLLTKTYSSLKTYADEEIAALEAVARGEWERLDSDIASVRTYAEAGFEAQASQNAAFTRQFSELSQEITSLDGEIYSVSRSLAEFKTFASANYASVSAVATLDSEVSNLKSGLTTVTNAQASFEAEVARTYATTTTLSQYTKKTYVDGQVQEVSRSLAEFKTYASNNYASVEIQTKVDNLGSHFSLDNSYITMRASSYESGVYIAVSTAGNATMSATNQIQISCSGGTYVSGRTGLFLQSSGGIVNVGGSATSPVSIRGKTVYWNKDPNGVGYFLMGI